MQRQMKASLYYLTSEIRFTMSVFWAILLSILVLSFVIDILFFQNSDDSMIFSFSGPIYIFSIIFAQKAVKDSIPHLIKMGSTRKNIFATFILYFFSFAFVNAFIANTVHTLVSTFYKKESSESSVGTVSVVNGEESFSFNHLSYFLEDTWLMRMTIDTTISFFLMAVTFIITLVFYRYGVIGGFSFIGGLIVLFLLGVVRGWYIEFFISLFSDLSVVFFFQLFGVGLIIYLLSFLLLRRLTIET